MSLSLVTQKECATRKERIFTEELARREEMADPLLLEVPASAR
jgi:hypothetical protein